MTDASLASPARPVALFGAIALCLASCASIEGITDITPASSGTDASIDAEGDVREGGSEPTDGSSEDAPADSTLVDTTPGDGASDALPVVDAPLDSPADSADSGGVPPSCMTAGAGTTMCGASAEGCCTSLAVPGGTYYRTYTNTGTGPSGEMDSASISTFRLDKYLVTVGRFRQFVVAWNGGSGWLPADHAGKHTHLNGGQGLINGGSTDGSISYEPGWMTSDNVSISPTTALLQCNPSFATWTPAAGANESLPINCVNWYESYAFCIWDGAFLPSEAEWEFAAAGGSSQLEYPWGSANPNGQYAIYGCDYPPGDSASCTGFANIAPVGTATAGAGLWGQLDLAGNVYEWGLDWYAAAYAAPCTDCAYLTPASFRVNRGGDFVQNAAGLLPNARGGAPSTGRSDGVGFRCARTP